LLGNPVRYDGDHKRNSYIVDTLTAYFDFHPFCPEVGIGLGVPRPPIRLVMTDNGLRVVGVKNKKQDVTDVLKAYSLARESEVAQLSGFIFKKGSPSCGTEGVAVFDTSGAVVASGAGLFAAVIMARFPALPVVEERHLQETLLRENFVERVIIYHQWRTGVAAAPTAQALAAFHARLEPSLTSRDGDCARRLGELVAKASDEEDDLTRLTDDYIAAAMACLRQPTSQQGYASIAAQWISEFPLSHDALLKRSSAGSKEG